MSTLKKALLLAALALAFLAPAAGAAISASAQPVASHTYVTADVTPNTSGCGGGASGHCG